MRRRACDDWSAHATAVATHSSLGRAFDIALPFFNVPLNFSPGKQGLSRTAGVGYNLAKFGGDVRAARNAGTPAERLAARTSAGENFAKAGISAGILTTAIGLSMNDSLTGDGHDRPRQARDLGREPPATQRRDARHEPVDQLRRDAAGRAVRGRGWRG